MRPTDRADEAPMSAQGLGEPQIQKLHLHCISSIPVGVASHDPSWLTPVIPALSEAKVGRSLEVEFKMSLANMVKHCLY